MIRDGWFFLIAGIIAVVSSIVDKRSLMVNDVDGQVRDEDKEKAKPTIRGRLLYGLVGVASAFYGWYLLRHR
jgi:hypothetical protein